MLTAFWRKKEEFSVFLKENNVCFISETHLTKQNFIKINGYDTHHTIRPDNQASGGSAIFIKNNLKYNIEHEIQKSKIQLTVLNVSSANNNLKIGAIYLPLKHNLKKEDYLQIIQCMGERFVIGC